MLNGAGSGGGRNCPEAPNGQVARLCAQRGSGACHGSEAADPCTRTSNGVSCPAAGPFQA